MRRIPTLALAISLVALTPAHAHHSFAIFDQTKIATIEGTVKEVQWTNPHIWLQITVPTADGGTEEWGIEGGPLSQLKERGLKKDLLHAGDKVVVKANPLRNGERGGSLISISRTDGTVIFGEPGGR